MINGKKIIAVMPAYNAEKTLEQTYAEIPMDIVDEVILTDDCSSDETVKKAKELKRCWCTSVTKVTEETKKPAITVHSNSAQTSSS